MVYVKRVRPAERQDGRDRSAYYREYYKRNREKLKAEQRERQAKALRRDPEARKGEHYMARYGITRDQYAAMLKAQGGVCAICGSPPRRNRLHVDHDHSTGRVRGLLCGGCNRVLGFVEKRPIWYEQAQKYLDG